MSKIGVIGAGVSGLVAAHLLSDDHEVWVYEANDYAGGHTRTVRVDVGEGSWDVDTGFIVFNERAYPHFLLLLARLGIAKLPTSMSFSVRCQRTGLEYGGRTLSSVFAQRRNLFRPSFYRMIRDILRFGREARDFIDSVGDDVGLLDYLVRNRYSEEFIERYVIPMGAAIWSADPDQMKLFPVRYFVRFFDHHGVLDIRNAPHWCVVSVVSMRYVERLTSQFRERLRLSCPISRVTRESKGVRVHTTDGEKQLFDEVVIATHSDQALEIIDNPTPREHEILGAIRYQRNDVVLHSDTTLMPRRRLAWSSWNYHIPVEPARRVMVTYNMNMLQSLDAAETFLVTLNGEDSIDPSRVYDRVVFYHPVFTPEAVSAQARHEEISGVDRVHYCGAYWRYGFHEDGVDSALAVCRRFGKTL
ncbi:MAG: FAD-dependent oxidoreductase [Acidobacteriota bacterium]|nr:MAG: FAD-dependent oxidoreductase [Acidobacteriota bacterium]